MLKVKLMPTGKKHQISYRLVIAPDRSKLNGNITDQIGFYTPQTKELKIDQQKLNQWIKNGAQLTIGVDKLLHPEKYPPKKYIKTKDLIKKTQIPVTPPAPTITKPVSTPLETTEPVEKIES